MNFRLTLQLKQASHGSVMPLLIVFMVVVGIIGVSVGGAIFSTLSVATTADRSETSLHIAEAGINYYLWHLNHNPADLTDGTGPATAGPLGYGPFTHQYRDINGREAGQFSLYIKQDSPGSTVSVVRSVGKAKDSKLTRTVEARLGAKAYSAYAVAGNEALWFGANETADGPVFSNVGVKMDGASNSTVSSANSQYIVPMSHGPGKGTLQDGVWCDPAVTSPIDCNTRNKSLWSFPDERLDFNRLSYDLCEIKKVATGGQPCSDILATRTGSYVPPVNPTTYGVNVGYLISLNNASSYNLYKVSSEDDTRPPTQAISKTLVAQNIPIPENGVIFVEDNVWLVTTDNSGFNGRVTIVAARLGVTGSANMVLAGNIKYADKYNGNDVIGGIAENNVEVAPYAGVPLEINGAYIAKEGSFSYRAYSRVSGKKTVGWVNGVEKFTFFGSVISNKLWTWSYVFCGEDWKKECWAGYKWNVTTYDENLRYNPPPSFPVTNTYDILSWREVLTSP